MKEPRVVYVHWNLGVGEKPDYVEMETQIEKQGYVILVGLNIEGRIYDVVFDGKRVGFKRAIEGDETILWREIPDE